MLPSHKQPAARTAVSLAVAASMLLGTTAAALPAAAAPAAHTAAVPATAEAPAAMSIENAQQIADIFNGINAFRAEKGLAPLRLGLAASEVAQEWAQEMSDTGLFEHSASHAEDLRVAGWSGAAENIAYNDTTRGQDLVQMWIDSPGHNANMSGAGDNVLGIGAALDGDRGLLWGSTSFYSYKTLPKYTYATADEFLAAVAVPAIPASKPAISGTAAIGSKLTAVPGTWPAGTKLSYRWFYNDLPADNETGSTLTVSALAGGQKISVEVTASAPGFRDTTVFSRQTAIVPYAKMVENTVEPVITGTPLPGNTLTVNPGTWTQGTTLSFLWNTGETGRSHVVAEGEDYASVTVTGTAPGMYEHSVEVRLEYPARELAYTVKPFTEKQAMEGVGLYANIGAWNVREPYWNTVWLRDGVPVPGSEDSLWYTPKPEDIGHRISFTVTVSEDGYLSRTVTSDETEPVKAYVAPPVENMDKPSITGVTTEGEKLTAEPGTWTEGASFAYQWLRAGQPVSGAVGETYTLTAADVDKTIAVKVTADVPGYTATSATSAATSPVRKMTPQAFKDVRPGAQFASEIQWLASEGISTGWNDKTFRPLDSVNRDAMAAFMYRLAGSPAYTAPKTSPFTDVAVTNPFYKEISWLAAEKISTGWVQADGTRTFAPLQPVKRDAMAAFMYRFDQHGYTLAKAK